MGGSPRADALLTMGVTRVHARSLATQFFLQIGPSDASSMRRETSRVSFLMCPFCVRELVPSATTALERCRGSSLTLGCSAVDSG